jgi:hypothetical protein
LSSSLQLLFTGRVQLENKWKKLSLERNSFVAKKYGLFSAYKVGFGQIKPMGICPFLDEKLKIPSQIVLRKTTVTLRGGVFLIKLK